MEAPGHGHDPAGHSAAAKVRGPVRGLAISLALACLALAGCGDGADGPLDTALGYLPADAPLAVIVPTDLDDGGAAEAVEEIPFGPLLLHALRSEVLGDGLDFERDVEPLLGNEAVIGLADPRAALAGGGLRGVVAALETEDGDALERLVRDRAERVGEAEGARLYRAGDEAFLAIDGDMLVAADSEDGLRAALARPESDDRLRESDVAPALDDLPEDAAARVVVNVAALLGADPEAEAARRVPFIGALKTLAATASLDDGRIAIDFALTASGDLDDDELPLATGDEAPPVIGRGRELGAGIRNPARLVAFAQEVARAVAPEGAARLEAAKRRIAAGGVDLDRDVVAQFEGDAAIALALDGGLAVRAELADPDAFERTLERLVGLIPDVARRAGLGDVGVSGPTKGFYAVAGENGDGVVFGVVDGVFVLSDDPERAADLAGERPRPVEGAKGALVAQADAGRLLSALLSELGELLGGLGIELPLGPLTATLAADEDGLRGRLTLALD